MGIVGAGDEGGEWVAVAVRWLVRLRLVGRARARRLMRHGGRDGAVVTVMGVVGDSVLRRVGGNVMVV